MSTWLSIRECARRLGVCTKTIRSKIAMGELRAAQLSKRMWRISEEELERYLRWRTTGETLNIVKNNEVKRSTPRSTDDGKMLRSMVEGSNREKVG
jgi:excisionase family DNA binding protein